MKYHKKCIKTPFFECVICGCGSVSVFCLLWQLFHQKTFCYQLTKINFADIKVKLYFNIVCLLGDGWLGCWWFDWTMSE